jgi:hypothetical protein
MAKATVQTILTGHLQIGYTIGQWLKLSADDTYWTPADRLRNWTVAKAKCKVYLLDTVTYLIADAGHDLADC